MSQRVLSVGYLSDVGAHCIQDTYCRDCRRPLSRVPLLSLKTDVPLSVTIPTTQVGPKNVSVREDNVNHISISLKEIK